MNRNVRTVLIVVVLLGALGVIAWQMWPKDTPPPAPEAPKATKPAPQPAQVQVVPPPEAPEVQAAVPAEPPAIPEEVGTEPVEQAPAEEDPFGGRPITIQTLTGCKEVQQFQGAQIVMEYARNGEWKVNGNVRAKWTIEDGRVKVYKDGSEEVHYVDIVGNKLQYNGKDVPLTR